MNSIINELLSQGESTNIKSNKVVKKTKTKESLSSLKEDLKKRINKLIGGKKNGRWKQKQK